jgi:hypothetical protein
LGAGRLRLFFDPVLVAAIAGHAEDDQNGERRLRSSSCR